MKTAVLGIEFVCDDFGRKFFVVRVLQENPQAAIYLRGYKRFRNIDKNKADRLFSKWLRLRDACPNPVKKVYLSRLNHTSIPIQVDAKQFRQSAYALCSQLANISDFFAKKAEKLASFTKL